MDKNLTDITIILDESGSMGSTINDTIGGFNTLINHQIDVNKANPENYVDVSMYAFNGQVRQVFGSRRLTEENKPILSTDNYRPGGSTSLLDAIGKAITETGERLRLTLPRRRAGKVLVVIITDGEENSSRHYTGYRQIADMIQHQQDVYSWEFVFMGADQDVIANASRLNIKAGSTFNYLKTSGGIYDSYQIMSNVVTETRLGLPKKETTAP